MYAPHLVGSPQSPVVCRGAGDDFLAPRGGLLRLLQRRVHRQQQPRHAVAPQALLRQIFQQLGRPPSLAQLRRRARRKQAQLGAAPAVLLAQREGCHGLHTAPHACARQALQLLQYLVHLPPPSHSQCPPCCHCSAPAANDPAVPTFSKNRWGAQSLPPLSGLRLWVVRTLVMMGVIAWTLEPAFYTSHPAWWSGAAGRPPMAFEAATLRVWRVYTQYDPVFEAPPEWLVAMCGVEVLLFGPLYFVAA
jgi:hypothetical protein